MIAPRRRILLFIYSLQAGGAERVAADLANHWVATGWEVAFVTVESADSDFYRLHPNVKRIALGLASVSRGPIAALLGNYRRVRALRRTLDEIQPSVALALMTQSNLVLALAALGLRYLVSIGSEHVHPPGVPLSWVWNSLRRYLYDQLDALSALTRESKEWLLEHTNARNVGVIPNAVAWPLSVHDPILPPRSVVLESRQLLLAVGRLEEQKGFDLLIQAFQEVAPKHSNWDLVILGEGQLRGQLMEQTATASLQTRVKLPGRAGNVGQWYEVADIYVMSSRFEGFGNTLAEAMAYGVPAISFDCDTGPRDIIRHEIDGLLVAPNDIAALSCAMDILMTRHDLRVEYGRRAREIRQSLSMERIASLWEKLFEDAHSRRG